MSKQKLIFVEITGVSDTGKMSNEKKPRKKWRINYNVGDQSRLGSFFGDKEKVESYFKVGEKIQVMESEPSEYKGVNYYFLNIPSKKNIEAFETAQSSIKAAKINCLTQCLQIASIYSVEGKIKSDEVRDTAKKIYKWVINEIEKDE